MNGNLLNILISKVVAYFRLLCDSPAAENVRNPKLNILISIYLINNLLNAFKKTTIAEDGY
jgi:hypothetical protein